MNWIDAWRGRRHFRRRVNEALGLILDHEEPCEFGYLRNERDAAIDAFNEVAAQRGWETRMFKPPRGYMPAFPGRAKATE